MRTLHVPDTVLSVPGKPPEAGQAVLVDGRQIVAVGPYEELAEANPDARMRRWPGGLLTPGLVNRHAAELLERLYHPDPREADTLGTEPLDPAAAGLEMDDTRWGASARRGLQRMLANGTTAVAGEFRRAAVREAVERSPLRHLTRAGGLPPRAADFAVFAVRDEAALAEQGASTCIATVIDGRLVYRRR
ncbi:imidazolonepropionase-like domain-containing protein [Streptomyces boninensis]|uniref:amidohydrolase family protein n=1 Tax=Streptomyces boninensis TaxID=2039455 RepID=UPI003B2253E1